MAAPAHVNTEMGSHIGLCPWGALTLTLTLGSDGGGHAGPHMHHPRATLRFRGLGPQAGAGTALSGDVWGASCGEASTYLQASGNLRLTG